MVSKLHNLILWYQYIILLRNKSNVKKTRCFVKGHTHHNQDTLSNGQQTKHHDSTGWRAVGFGS